MKKIIYILFFISCIVKFSFAQDLRDASHSVIVSIPDIAVVDIEGSDGNDITLVPSFSGEAGEGLDFSEARDNSLWLNYTSLLSNESTRRKITVKMDGTLPQGMRLRVNPGTPTGVGDLGNARNAFRITDVEKNLITVIKNCYTNDGVGNGSQLTYSLIFNNNRFRNLQELNSVLTITYTIVDY